MTSSTNTSATSRKPTRQQTAVAELLERSDDFTSAQTVHARLRDAGAGVGLATVYRACSTHHHHHLVCRACGRTVEVEGPAVERWADTVARDHGFSGVTHTLEIFGTCADCTAAAP